MIWVVLPPRRRQLVEGKVTKRTVSLTVGGYWVGPGWVERGPAVTTLDDGERMLGPGHFTSRTIRSNLERRE